MRLHGYYHKLQRNIDDYGLATALWKTWMYFVVLFYEHRIYRLYAIDLASYEGTVSVDAPAGPFKFSILKPDEYDAIAQIETMAEWLEGILLDRIQSGDICLVVRDGDLIAGFNLISFGECYIPLLKRSHCFKLHQAWSEHIAVHKNYRRFGLATGLRQRIFSVLKERGVTRLYGGTLITNLPALKLSRKLGFREFADVEYLKIGFWRQWNNRRVRHVAHD